MIVKRQLELREEREERTGKIDRHFVLEKYLNILNINKKDIVKEDGSYIPVQDWPDELLNFADMTLTHGKDGITRVNTIDLESQVKVIERIDKMLAMEARFDEKNRPQEESTKQKNKVESAGERIKRIRAERKSKNQS